MGLARGVTLAGLVLALTACSEGLPRSVSPIEEGAEQSLAGEELLDALADGGLVLYLRHTETTEGGVDSVDTLGDCSAQRELSDKGRADARQIGEAIRELDIPVGRVVASPFCRTVETAELAFDDEVTTDPALLALASTAKAGDTDPRREAAALALIATEPEDGTNTVLVGHVSNVEPVTGVAPEEGGTAVFRPDGAGRVTLVAEVPPDGWQRLAEEHG